MGQQLVLRIIDHINSFEWHLKMKMTFKVISRNKCDVRDDRARLIARIWDHDGVVHFYEIMNGPKEIVRGRATDEAVKFVDFLSACGADIEPDYDVQFEDRTI